MTLVIAWRSEDALTVCADTRIENETGPITDVGQKLFQVPVYVTPMGIEGLSYPKLSVGFAFAGNTLMAQSCCVIASTCLASLSVKSREDAVTPGLIASFFTRSAEYVSKERRFLRPKENHSFHAIVFGWDEGKKAPFVYDIEVKDQEGGLVALCTYRDVPLGGLAYFGSGAPFIEKALAQWEAKGEPLTLQPHRLMEAAIADRDLRSVGGSLQFSTATEEGVRLRPVMRVQSSGMAEFFVLGCDIWALADPNGPTPGAGAVVLEEPD